MSSNPPLLPLAFILPPGALFPFLGVPNSHPKSFFSWQAAWARTTHLPGTGLHACLGWSRCGRRCLCSPGSRGRPHCPGPHRCTGGGQEVRPVTGWGLSSPAPHTLSLYGMALSFCSPPEDLPLEETKPLMLSKNWPPKRHPALEASGMTSV